MKLKRGEDDIPPETVCFFAVLLGSSCSALSSVTLVQFPDSLSCVVMQPALNILRAAALLEYLFISSLFQEHVKVAGVWLKVI